MPLTVPVSCTAVTPGSRVIMPGAATGSSAVAPERVCPLVTVSRLVPRRLISFSSAALEEAAKPRTATIAATPIAMPSADSPARSLRVRSPALASPARSEGRSRAAAAGDCVVVGDDDDRGPLLVEFFQQGQDGGAGGRVQVPGRLVGQHYRWRAR